MLYHYWMKLWKQMQCIKAFLEAIDVCYAMLWNSFWNLHYKVLLNNTQLYDHSRTWKKNKNSKKKNKTYSFVLDIIIYSRDFFFWFSAQILFGGSTRSFVLMLTGKRQTNSFVPRTHTHTHRIPLRLSERHANTITSSVDIAASAYTLYYRCNIKLKHVWNSWWSC